VTTPRRPITGAELTAALTIASLLAFGAPPAAAAASWTASADPGAPASSCAQAVGFSAPGSGAGARVPSVGGTVWGLAIGRVPPSVGDDLKIVWRVTGRGPLRVSFTDPAGRRRPLSFGPERHLASNFVHLGAEWGTGFRFDRPGCWTIRLTRTGTRATVRLGVA
jgi:hypothetical protein